MQKNNQRIRKSRLNAARKNTLANRSYSVFPGTGLYPVRVKDNTVVIGGRVNSGKTYAQLVAAVHLLSSTPRPPRGKRHLMGIFLEGEPDGFIYGVLRALIGRTGKYERTDKNRLDVYQHFRSLGFDLVIYSHEDRVSNRRALRNFAKLQETHDTTHILYEWQDTPYPKSTTGLNVETHNGCAGMKSIGNILSLRHLDYKISQLWMTHHAGGNHFTVSSGGEDELTAGVIAELPDMPQLQVRLV